MFESSVCVKEIERKKPVSQSGLIHDVLLGFEFEFEDEVLGFELFSIEDLIVMMRWFVVVVMRWLMRWLLRR